MKLAIILGTIREGRQSERQVKWVLKAAQTIEGTETEIVDLKDYPMPFFAEPVSPRYNPARKPAPEVQKWLDKLAEFDAYVFVTPEYNHSVPAVLKNALDYVDFQLVRKPVAVISHGTAGGARAEVALKEILSESRMVPMPTIPGLAVTGLGDKIDEEGNLSQAEQDNPYGAGGALSAMLAELKWYSDALSIARANS